MMHGCTCSHRPCCIRAPKRKTHTKPQPSMGIVDGTPRDPPILSCVSPQRANVRARGCIWRRTRRCWRGPQKPSDDFREAHKNPRPRRRWAWTRRCSASRRRRVSRTCGAWRAKVWIPGKASGSALNSHVSPEIDSAFSKILHCCRK